MANDISSNPWYVDTAGTIYTNKTKLKTILWNEAASVGDQLLVKDTNGKIIVNTRCNQVNYPQPIVVDGWFNGIVVTTLTSGTLMFYLEF
jgi:formylmethanofuran dehydrogenase subunit D